MLLPALSDGILIDSVYYWIYLFHMPAFVFVSGYFSKNYVNRQDKEHKIAGFIALFVLFTFLLFILKLIFEHSIHLGAFLRPSGAPWYLLSMIFWYLLIPFVSRINTPVAFISLFVIGLLSGLFTDCGDFLSLSRTIVFFPFFLIGFYFNGNLCDKIRLWMRIVSIVFLLLCALTIFYYHDALSSFFKVIYGNCSYEEAGLTVKQGIIYRSIWYAVATIMTVAIMCIIPKKRWLLTYIGERTLGIYILHRLIRDIIKYTGLYDYCESEYVLLSVCLLLSVIITLVTSIRPFASLLSKFLKLSGLFIKKRPNNISDQACEVKCSPQ